MLLSTLVPALVGEKIAELVAATVVSTPLVDAANGNGELLATSLLMLLLLLLMLLMLLMLLATTDDDGVC